MCAVLSLKCLSPTYYTKLTTRQNRIHISFARIEPELGYLANMTERTPPKFASNPNLSTITAAEDNFINMRKRKQPDADDIEDRLKLLEKRSDCMMNVFSRMIDESIASLKSTITCEFTKITASIDAMNSTITGLRSDNASFKESLNNINTRLAEMEKSLGAVDLRQDTLEKRLKSVENQISVTTDLPNTLKSLENKLALMEQQARDCNIEIVNLPDRRNENLVNIVMNLGTAVKQQIQASDIVAVHRVPHADQKDTRPKNIVVKFTTRVLRDNVLSSSRLMKGLNTEHLGISGSKQNIFVNEHLTLQNKRLFRECRDRAKKCEYRYVWIKHGVILARKSDTSPVVAIRTERDINKIK